MGTTSKAAGTADRTRGARLAQVVAVLLLGALLLAACGDDADQTTADAVDVSERPDDDAGGSAGATGGATEEPADAPEAATAERDLATSSVGAEDGADEVAPGTAPPEQQVGLKAGSVDDNVDWEAYLRYREDFARLGIPVDDLAVDGRRILSVVDAAGDPVLDATIEIGDTILRTGSDGRAVYLGPPAQGQQGTASDVEAVVRHGTTSTTHTVGAEPAQTIVLDTERPAGVRLDLLFLVDATGSMDDEIERLKANMVGVAERIDAFEPRPDVRFGLTSYRDEGDEYVARTVDFVSDVDRFVESLRGVVADGGGDVPEAFNEAFADAVSRPTWREEEGVVRLVVLLADAPPHVGRGPSYVDTIADAAAAGIRVFPVASSGTDDQAEYIFRQVAQATLGRFVFLTYGADGAAVGPSSNVDELDYDVLSLDDLVVRLVEEQLAPLA